MPLNRSRFVRHGKPHFVYMNNREHYGKTCLLVPGHAMHYGGERGSARTVTCECGFSAQAYGNMVEVADRHLKEVRNA